MWFTPVVSSALLATLAFSNGALGISLNLDDEASVKSVASTIAYDMMTYYRGNVSGQTPGILPGPPPNPSILNAGYFWWESGAMWGSLIDYWYYTGDTTYNKQVTQGMLFQVGEDKDYQPRNQTLGMGNDDQAFWGMSAMTAAEFNFPNPPADQPQWLALAQAVYNTQKPRWDSQHCGGGLRWQAYAFLNGYNYKNSISNGCYLNLAARLARYTSNDTYAAEAEKTWVWMRSVGFLTDSYQVFDGAHIETNCTDVNPLQFSYNAAIMIHGAAVMYNYTGSLTWRDRLENLLNATLITFFPDDIANEVACEAALACNIDMFSMKAYLARWLAATTQLAPFTFDWIMPKLRTSAAAAALQCSGGANGRMCGLSWGKKGQWDGTSGVGQQMAALEVIQGTLITKAVAPVTNTTGGTSVGDVNAGISAGPDPRLNWPTIKDPDRVGAAILTAVIIMSFMSLLGWMVYEPGMFTAPKALKPSWPAAVKTAVLTKSG